MPQTVLAGVAAPVWKSGAISKDAVQYRYRVNTALRDATDASLYPFRVEVGVQMADPGWAGLPTAAEKQRLAVIEEKVLAVVGARAVLAAVLTAAGLRRYIFYTENAELAAELNGQLQDALGDGTFGVLPEPDRDWRAYRWLLKRERRKPLWAAVLCAVLLLWGAAVLHAYGPAWAIGEVALPVFLFYAALRTRLHAQWCLDHRVRMFGGFTLLLATIPFGLISLSGLTVWANAAVSLGVGAVLVASVWKAQLKFWREQTPPVSQG